MKYVISYNTEFGTLSAESKKPADLAHAYYELKEMERSILKLKKTKNSGAHQEASSSRRGGKGETARVLHEIETSLLGTSFFSNPRTTGETRDRLKKLSGRSFTSRKVSQALGILRNKKKLKRNGSRNFFAYSTV